MIRKSFALFILCGVTAALAAGQQTPEPRPDRQNPAPRAFAFSFGDDGGYLGVQTTDITRDNFSKFGLKEVRGVAVEKVLENSPAAAAGLQNGDVITRLNGEPITSVRKLTRLISEISPDHQVKLTVTRGGNERELVATLGKRPVPRFDSGAFEFNVPQTPVAPGDLPDFSKDFPVIPRIEGLPRMPELPAEGDTFVWRAGSSRQIGVSVSPLTKQLGDHFGVAEGALLINTVRDNSPASKSGLRAGDIIIEVDGKTVKGDFDLIRAIGAKKDGDVELTIIRDKNRQTIRVTPEAGKTGPMFDSFQNGQQGFELLRRLIPANPAAPGGPEPPLPMTLFRPGSRVL